MSLRLTLELFVGATSQYSARTAIRFQQICHAGSRCACRTNPGQKPLSSVRHRTCGSPGTGNDRAKHTRDQSASRRHRPPHERQGARQRDQFAPCKDGFPLRRQLRRGPGAGLRALLYGSWFAAQLRWPLPDARARIHLSERDDRDATSVGVLSIAIKTGDATLFHPQESRRKHRQCDASLWRTYPPRLFPSGVTATTRARGSTGWSGCSGLYPSCW
jgi:hypothetical protein